MAAPIKSDPLKYKYEAFNAAMSALPIQVSLGTLSPRQALAEIVAAKLVLSTAVEAFKATPRGKKPSSQDKWTARAKKADESEKAARAAIQQAASRALPTPPKPAKESTPLLQTTATASPALTQRPKPVQSPPLPRQAAAAESSPLHEKVVFLAQRNEALVDSPLWETARKIASFIVYVLLICSVFGIPIAIARWFSKKILLPADRLTSEEIRTAESFITKNALINGQIYTIDPIAIQTADGAELRGFHYRNAAAREDSPTVIYFNGNCGSCLESPVLGLGCLSTAEHPLNFVSFDYRGVGLSSESRPIESARDLVRDGDAVYQYVRDHLGVEENRIHVYGRSLGGAVAAETLALQPDWRGALISDRSFSRTKDFLPRGAQFLAALDRINLDAAEACGKLQGRLTVLVATDDPVIPLQARLYQKLLGRKDIIVLPQVLGENAHNYNFLSGDSRDAETLRRELSSRLRAVGEDRAPERQQRAFDRNTKRELLRAAQS